MFLSLFSFSSRSQHPLISIHMLDFKKKNPTQWRLHNCGNTTEATTLLQQFRPLGWYFLLVSGPATLGIAGPGLKKKNNNRFFLRFFFENPTRTVGCVTDAETLGAQGYTVGDQNATQLVKRRRKRKHAAWRNKKSSVPCACGAILPTHLPMT